MVVTGDAQERRTHVPASAQGLLFDDDLPELSEDIGYRGPTACRAAGLLILASFSGYAMLSYTLMCG